MTAPASLRLRITHDTWCDYGSPLRHARHLAHLLPRPTRWQQVLQTRLHIHPAPAERHDSLDLFGNWRSYFEIEQAHARLHVRASSLLHTHAPAPARSQQSWESVRQAFTYRAGAPWHPAAEFAYPSTHIHPGPAFADYARPCFAPGRPLIEAARALMQRIHQDFQYAAHSTSVHTPAAQALAQRRGVCQDFAHVMLACLRSLGLPARYVSGYLLTQPPPGQPRLVGSDASHAWASVFLPDLAAASGHGWYDLDPTNARSGWGSPGADYVRLAIGRDFADVSPLRGIIEGGHGAQRLRVGVTVEPFEAPSLDDAPPLPDHPPLFD